MATTNINEAGWFYHAPAKRQPQERPVDYPPASQIPGLGEYSVESDQPSPPPELVFKDTDTKYIRLAKMGGRKDLLCMNPRADLREKEPVGYPRNDWFYLEDNAVEDAAEKRDLNWQFLLPDYMVHEEHRSDPAEGGPAGDRKRPMWGYDKLTAFQREGETVTDKTVKLPELRRPGYGVRNSKPVKVVMKQPSHVVRLRGQPAPPQQTSAKPRSSGAVASGDRHAQMDLILANKYQQEWQDSRQQQRSPRHVPCRAPAAQSEYKEAYSLAAKASAKERKKSAPASKERSPLPLEKLAGSSAKQQQEVEKERFILSRFKKVGSKIDSHQKPKSMVAAN